MRGHRATAFCAASVLASSVVLTSAAHADPPPSLRVMGQDSGCPTPKQVAAVLDRMLPRTKVTADAGPAGATDAAVSDEGAHVRVMVAGQERSFDDGGRQCSERARHAAVFIALVVDPPSIAESPSESPEVPPRAAPSPDATRPPAEQRPRGWQWDLALGGVLLVAPQGEHRSSTAAQGVAVFARRKHGFHLGLGAGVLHGTLHFDVADADAWWIPIDLTAGVAAKSGRWEIGVELGPSASILSIIGENLNQTERQVRVEIGGRFSVGSRFWFTKQFAGFLSAEAVVRPFPHVLDIDPRGNIGEMPALWLGASAGFAFSVE